MLHIFMIKKYLKKDFTCIFLPILHDYVLQKDEGYYPQVFLEELKYMSKVKKKLRHITCYCTIQNLKAMQKHVHKCVPTYQETEEFFDEEGQENKGLSIVDHVYGEKILDQLRVFLTI